MQGQYLMHGQCLDIDQLGNCFQRQCITDDHEGRTSGQGGIHLAERTIVIIFISVRPAGVVSGLCCRGDVMLLKKQHVTALTVIVLMYVREFPDDRGTEIRYQEQQTPD